MILNVEEYMNCNECIYHKEIKCIYHKEIKKLFIIVTKCTKNLESDFEHIDISKGKIDYCSYFKQKVKDENEKNEYVI